MRHQYAEESLGPKDEANLTRYMFQKRSIYWDLICPSYSRRAVRDMEDAVNKLCLDEALRSEISLLWIRVPGTVKLIVPYI